MSGCCEKPSRRQRATTRIPNASTCAHEPSATSRGAIEWRGDLARALDAYAQSIAAAEACIEITRERSGEDEYGTRAVIVNGLVSRASTYAQAGRMEEAFASTDAAGALLGELGDAPDAGVVRFQLHNIRSTLLVMSGRLQEAEAEAHRAVSAAMAANPALATHAYTNLSAIAQRTGDSRSEDYLRLSHELQEQDPHGDAVSHQLAVENLARAALQGRRFEEARARFADAERLALESGLPERAAAARTGLAAVALQTGRVGKAVRELQTLVGRFEASGSIDGLREVHQFIGDAESARARYARAEEHYLAARDLTRTVHERCRVDLRRAEMHAEWAADTPGLRTRIARLERARDLALPVHLVTDALRDGFSPGPTRERWSAQLAAPARELAFRLAMTLNDGALMIDLLENEAARATLRAERPAADGTHGDSGLVAELLDFAPARGRPVEDPESGRAPAPPIPVRPARTPGEPPRLPAAAGFFAELAGGADAGAVRFALPPRVIPSPGLAPALADWIEAAEAEYGVRIRSDEAVAAW